jgi:hypothetical protein
MTAEMEVAWLRAAGISNYDLYCLKKMKGGK